MNGGNGHDTLHGDASTAATFGGGSYRYLDIGDDTLSGGEGNDVMYDGAGSDLLQGGGGGDDTIHGGTDGGHYWGEIDTLPVSNTLFGDDGDDYLISHRDSKRLLVWG